MILRVTVAGVPAKPTTHAQGIIKPRCEYRVLGQHQ